MRIRARQLANTEVLSTSIIPALPASKLPALTGDVITSVGTSATTLATVNSNVGSFGSGTVIPVLTINAKGLVTAVSTAAVPTYTAGTGIKLTNGAFAIDPAIVARKDSSQTFAGALIAPSIGPAGLYDLFTIDANSTQINGNASVGGDMDVNGTIYVAGQGSITSIFARRLAKIITYTANRTATLADGGSFVRMDVSTANTFTIAANASMGFEIGTTIQLQQVGVGQTSFVAASGVTIQSDSNFLKLKGQFSAATLVKIGTDIWSLIGSLVA